MRMAPSSVHGNGCHGVTVCLCVCVGGGGDGVCVCVEGNMMMSLCVGGEGKGGGGGRVNCSVKKGINWEAEFGQIYYCKPLKSALGVAALQAGERLGAGRGQGWCQAENDTLVIK